jgi:probable F420-dependent oxidoreductase
VNVGVALRCSYAAMPDVAVAADECGFESVWIPEHLIFSAQPSTEAPGTLAVSPDAEARRLRPTQSDGSPYGGSSGRPPVPPDIPTYDALMWLATIAQATTRVRLGTYVYNLALRHPFVAARAVQTLDILSGGRVELGVGAGWSAGEYAATGIDFASRGRRLDECIDVLRLLWTQDRPGFRGELFAFDPVVFEPKPVQDSVPILVGGESDPALRRAAARGDGWIAMMHPAAEVGASVGRLRTYVADAGRDPAGITVTVGGNPTNAEELAAYADAGVDRLIVAPWRRSAEAVDSVRRFAETVLAPYQSE